MLSRPAANFRIRIFHLTVWTTAAIAVSAQAFAQAPTSNGVAVLNDGRVFQGAVQEVPGGYRIQYPGGSSILPFDQVSITSATLVGAYEAYRDSIRTPNADSHLRLAEWCLTNGLYAQADLEVQSALRLEPLRSDAKALLGQLDAILRPNQAARTLQQAVSQQPATAPRAAISVAAFSSESQKSETSLSRQTQLDFMRKVQPLMINKCGNAGCHGGNPDNGMMLKNARFDSPGLRLASEHNQKVLLSLINYERPEQSLLLTKPVSSDPYHEKLFNGPRTQAQFEILDQWVRQVALERSPGIPIDQVKTASAEDSPMMSTLIQPGKSIQRVSAEVVVETPPQSAPEPNRLPGMEQANPLQEGNASTAARPQVDTDFLDQIRKSHAPDAFDPEEFNRKMHSVQPGTP